jgi:hypothetical protein
MAEGSVLSQQHELRPGEYVLYAAVSQLRMVEALTSWAYLLEGLVTGERGHVQTETARITPTSVKGIREAGAV